MMMLNATNREADPVQRLAARIVARIEAADGACQSMDRRNIRELAHAVAWQWIEATGRPDALPSEWLPRVCRALTACGAPETATLLMFFDTRLVQPANWTFHGEQPFWILDCSLLKLHETERTALMLDRCLATILVRLAPLWDTVAGVGALGLRRSVHLATALANDHANRRRQRRRVDGPLQALRRQCADRLAVLARQRKWAATPDVVLLPT